MDFTRYEIKIAKISNKALSKERLIGRLTDLAIAMKTLGYKKKQWENLFYILTFQTINDNFESINNGQMILTNKTQPLSTNRKLGEIVEQSTNWDMFTSDHQTSLDLPKTFSYLKNASEPLSEFVKLSARYGFLY